MMFCESICLLVGEYHKVSYFIIMFLNIFAPLLPLLGTLPRKTWMEVSENLEIDANHGPQASLDGVSQTSMLIPSQSKPLYSFQMFSGSSGHLVACLNLSTESTVVAPRFHGLASCSNQRYNPFAVVKHPILQPFLHLASLRHGETRKRAKTSTSSSFDDFQDSTELTVIFLVIFLVVFLDHFVNLTL